MTTAPDQPRSSATASSRGFRWWLHDHRADVIDFFVYVTVLNLAIQFFPRVLSESFALSLLTALLLKVALELVLLLKGAILRGRRAATSKLLKWGAILVLWLVAAGSKFVVLILVDVVFGDAVSLGGFISVTALIVTLLLSRAGVRWLLREPQDAP